MTCQDLVAFMLDYLEGTLPEDVRRRFDAHLAECVDCVAYLRDYRATIAAAAQATEGAPPRLPDALAQAIVDSVRRE